MTSIPAPRPRRWLSQTYVLAGLLLAGGALLAIGIVQVLLDSYSDASTTVLPVGSIDVRARFSSLAPDDQSTGFAVAPDGSLGIVDRSDQRVVRLDATGGQIAEWGPRFEAAAAATDLNGLAADNAGDWYLLDRGQSRILRLDETGQVIGVVDLGPLGVYGPNGLAVDAHDNLYLADTGHNRILVFGPGGAPTRTIGSAGAGPGQLKQPMAMAFGPDGSMFVTDFENSRIERWAPDLQQTSAWTLPTHAWGVAVDHLGRVFVPDADQRLVRMYDADGHLLAELGGSPDASIPLRFPTQVALAPDASALWVLGQDGLARIDLTPLANVTQPADSSAPAMPIIGAGLVLSLLALAAFGWQARPWRLRWSTSPSATISHPSQGVPPAGRAPSLARAWPARSAPLLLIAGSLLLVLGTLAVAVAPVVLGAPATRADPWPWLGILVGGGVVFAAGCWLTAAARPIRWVSPWACSAATTHAWRWSWRAWAGAGAAFVGLLAGADWWVGGFETYAASRTLLLWLPAVVLAVVASATFRWRRPGLLAVIVLGLFVLALLPRVWNVADLPFGIWYDEAQGVLEIRRVLHQGTYTPILNTYGRDTSGFFYLIPAFWPVLGDTIGAARTTAGLVGALAVVATVLLGTEMFGWRVGLAAGGLLAFMRWHLNFSRLVFNSNSLPLGAAVAFWLLARAIKRGRWSDTALAGLALGLGLHGYTGFRGMLPVAILALGYAALTERWPAATLAARLGLYFGAALLTGLPVVLFAVQNPTAFNARTAQTLILAAPVDNTEKLRELWENIQKHLLMFDVAGDMNGRHNLPGLPMLDPLTASLVALGLGWLLLRPRDWRTVLLLAWAMVALASGFLTFPFEAPQAVRTFAITPVLAVLGGLGLVALLDRFVALVTIPRRVNAWRARALACALAVLAVGWIGFTNLDTFFNHQMKNAATWSAFSTRETILAKAVRDGRGQYESVFGSATLTPSLQAELLVPDLLATMHVFDPAQDLPYRGTGSALVYLETEHDLPLVAEVERWYPDAVRLPGQPPDGSPPIVQGFRLDATVLDRHRGLRARYRGVDGSTVERTEAQPTSSADALPVALPADASWEGVLALDDSGEYGFRVPPGFELRLDDAVLPAAAADGARVRLVRGAHRLALTGTVRADLPAALDWRTPTSADWAAVPERALSIAPDGGLGLQVRLAPLPETGDPLDAYVDPVPAHYFHISPFAGLPINPPAQWAAEWTGGLDVPTTGTYVFELDHSQHAGLWIDGTPLLSDLGQSTAPLRGSVDLTAGRHALRLRFEKTEEGAPWIYLYWTPPSAPRAVVPGSALSPPPPEVLGK